MTTPVISQNNVNTFGWSDAVSQNVWGTNYRLLLSRTQPLTAKVAGGAASGTAGDTNIMYIDGKPFEYNVKGTQTILAPIIRSISNTVTALDVNSQDQTDNDGIEIRPSNMNAGPGAFKVGTDPAFYFRARFSIADVSGTDDCLFGFAKVEAYQANVDDYADMACFNINNGDVLIETITGGAATSTTDTTLNWADGETHELEVLVSSAGVVTVLFDGQPTPVFPSYTFTNGLFVVPMIFFLNSADVAGQVNMVEYEYGYQTV